MDIWVEGMLHVESMFRGEGEGGELAMVKVWLEGLGMVEGEVKVGINYNYYH